MKLDLLDLFHETMLSPLLACNKIVSLLVSSPHNEQSVKCSANKNSRRRGTTTLYCQRPPMHSNLLQFLGKKFDDPDRMPGEGLTLLELKYQTSCWTICWNLEKFRKTLQPRMFRNSDLSNSKILRLELQNLSYFQSVLKIFKSQIFIGISECPWSRLIFSMK